MKEKVKIYELKNIAYGDNNYYRMSFDYAQKHNFKIEDYKCVYDGDSEEIKEYPNDGTILEKVKAVANYVGISRPEKYTGGPITASCIIEINEDMLYKIEGGWVNVKNGKRI